jgi:hypothetical protein
VFGVLFLKGAIAPGAPNYPLKLLFPHSPGFYTAPHRLDTAVGLNLFVSDLLPILAALFGGAWLLVRTRDAAMRGSWLVYAAITSLSVFVFATLEYNGSGLENHRFIITPMLFTPLFVAAWLVPREGSRARLTGVAELIMLLAVGLGAASTLDWFGGGNPGGGALNDCRSGEIDVAYYRTNCRTQTGGGVVTSRAKPAYVDPAVLYLYAGCRPTFIAGPPVGRDRHDVKMGTARMGLDALVDVSRDPHFGVGDRDLEIVCGTSTFDPACTAAAKAGTCTPSGSDVTRCKLSAGERETVLRSAGK